MTYLLDTTDLRDLALDVIDDVGMPRVMPASYYEDTTPEERAWLGIRFGLYSLPTEELCSWLQDHIDARPAIEIGAGNGRMAEHIGISATDSRMQEDPDIVAYYESLGQPLVRYGDNVEGIEALDAVRKHQPAVVVGAWITHRYDPAEHWRGGNQFGPDIGAILDLCDEYVMIGNDEVHALNPLWALPHDVHFFPWLHSRAVNRSPDFVAIWRRDAGAVEPIRVR